MRDQLGMRRPPWLGFGVVLAVGAALPLVTSSSYLMDVFTLSLIYMALNQSWNFLIGQSRIGNFGHLAFFAIGAYGLGILSVHLHVTPWLGLMAGGLGAALVSLPLGAAVLRLYGIYTSLLTFAFAEALQLVILNDNTGFTGGVFGLSGVGQLFSGNAEAHDYYWAALVLAAVATGVFGFLSRSPAGLALRAMGDSRRAVAVLGGDRVTLSLSAFAVSAFFAGLAGGLYASYYQTIDPNAILGLDQLTLMVTMIVVGGMGSLAGPVVGTAIMVGLQGVLLTHGQVQTLATGVILLVVVVLVPHGIVPALGGLRMRVAAWVAEGEASKESIEPEDG